MIAPAAHSTHCVIFVDIIPYPQIPQEFVSGFTRRSSALAEPDNDKINAMSKHLVLASRIYAAEGFHRKPSLIVFIIP